MGNRNALGRPRANKRMTPTATPGLLQLPDAAHGNTFRKSSRPVFHVLKALASSAAATFNPGMQRTREDFRHFTVLAQPDATGLLLPRSLHSFIS